MEELIVKLKETLKDIRIVEHDIQTCRDFNDYEDMGFYQQQRSDLYKELVEEVEELIKELDNENN